MKEIESLKLRSKVIGLINEGKVDGKTLEKLINGESIAESKVLKTLDIMSDGKTRTHETSEKEAIAFVVKSENFDEIMNSIKKEREKYLKQADRANKARKNASKKTEKKPLKKLEDPVAANKK